MHRFKSDAFSEVFRSGSLGHGRRKSRLRGKRVRSLSNKQTSAAYYRLRETDERARALVSNSNEERLEHLRLANRYGRLARQAEILSGQIRP